MRRLRVLLVATLVLVTGILGVMPASAQDVDNFKITSFEADYYLTRNDQKTSLMEVREKIVALFPDIDQNHGILRAIPSSYQGHTVSLEVQNVGVEGKSIISDDDLKWTTYTQNDNQVLKIGNPERYVHGEVTYFIKYTLRNVVQNFPTHDELYWDVNGDQWPQVFDSVIARIHIPDTLSAYLQERQVCYGGTAGQSGCTIERAQADNETVITTQTTRPLGAFETLTFVLGFEPGTFVPGPEIAREALLRKVKYTAIGLGVILPPLAAGFIMYRRWRAFGDDPKGRGVIVPEYQPPKKLNVLTSDFLLAQKLRNQAFSAALVELAVSRFLNIHEIPKKGLFGKTDYELELIKSPAGLPKEQQTVIQTVFSASEPGAKVKISDIKKSASLRSSIHTSLKSLEDHLAAELHKRNYFIKNPKKIKNGYFLWGTGLLGIGFAIAFIPFAYPVGIGMVLAGLVTALFAFYMPARTLAGVEAHDALLGLKDYIDLAEADRLKFGQSPEGAEKIKAGGFNPNDPKMRVKLFESLLPYAMLYGLEKQWGKQFEGIYAKPPDWYSGHGTFSAAYLGSSLSGFSSASSTTFSSPSSSSGSGFSGGSSGGGGGGGGGGGW